MQPSLIFLQLLRASPVFRAPGFTAAVVASAINYVVAFLGAATRRLLKISLKEDMQKA